MTTNEYGPANYLLMVVGGPDVGHEHELRDGDLVVGRSRDCGLTLADPAASRKHVRLISRGAVLEALDMGTSYGTFVNGERISRERLKAGDRLRVGDSVIEVRVADA